jgi:hypothetical protein
MSSVLFFSLGCFCALALFVGAPAPAVAGDLVPAGASARLHIGTPVFAIAFAPHGKFLVSGSDNGDLRMWETHTGRPVRRYVGHHGGVKAVALTPNGQILASGGADGTVRLWDIADARELRRLNGHEGGVEAVACAPDGKLLASAGHDNMVRLWRISDGKELHQLKGHEQVVRALAFAPDGQVLASGSHDRTLRLWKLSAADEWRRFWTPGWIYSVAFTRDGKVVASGGRDQTIRLWNVPSGRRISSLGGFDGPIGGVAFVGGGRTIATGTEDRKVRLWQLDSRRLRAVLGGHRGAVLTLAVAPGGKTLASADASGMILVWELESLDFLWLDLGSMDDSVGREVAAKLAAAPAAVAFLEKRLQALLERTFHVDLLIQDLSSEQFAVRLRATHELEKLGMSAESALRQALAETLPLESHRRIEQLLGKLLASDEELRYSERLRISRAVAVLERIGNSEARRVLQRVAEGPSGARFTREARAAMARLSK